MKILSSVTLFIAALFTNAYSADPQQPDQIQPKKSSPRLIKQLTPPRITIISKAPSDDNLECKKILATFLPEEKSVYNFFRALAKDSKEALAKEDFLTREKLTKETKATDAYLTPENLTCKYAKAAVKYAAEADKKKIWICRYIYKEIFSNAVDHLSNQNRKEVEIVIKKDIRLDLNICKQHNYYYAWRNYDSECIILIKFLLYKGVDTKSKSRYPFCTALLFTANDGSYLFDAHYHELIKYKDEYIFLRKVFSPETIDETIENCKLEIPYEEKTYTDKHNRYHTISNGGTRAYQFSGNQCSSAYEIQKTKAKEEDYDRDNFPGSLWF